MKVHKSRIYTPQGMIWTVRKASVRFAMMLGYTIPPPLVLEGNGHYFLTNGNHRTSIQIEDGSEQIEVEPDTKCDYPAADVASRYIHNPTDEPPFIHVGEWEEGDTYDLALHCFRTFQDTADEETIERVQDDYLIHGIPLEPVEVVPSFKPDIFYVTGKLETLLACRRMGFLAATTTLGEADQFTREQRRIEIRRASFCRSCSLDDIYEG